MNAFVTAIQAPREAYTENGMKALNQTGDACVNLFYAIGSSRNKNIIPQFVAAYVENPEAAIRIALWARDARGGAGERQTFRSILNYLSDNKSEFTERVLNKIPNLGRYDDLYYAPNHKNHAFKIFKDALEDEKTAGLAAKWADRKGINAAALRNYMGLTPKAYRKMLVNSTKVVESQMCSNDWGNINYSHVPSVASSRYMKAFNRHDPVRYGAWKEDLKTGKAKVNASVLYPYEVIRSIYNGDKEVALAQWEALPDYMGDQNILPVVDVSGSMTCKASGSVTCLDVALSLGLYLADKNKGAFKDTFVTFSENPELYHLKGNLLQKLEQMSGSDWMMNTDLHAVFNLVLKTAKDNSVPQADMPNTILILSDMQFDSCVEHGDSALEMIRRKYNEAGYQVPSVVFWNLNAHYKNVPAKHNENGVALVSGFSPAIMKNLLGGADITPELIMWNVIGDERYNF